MIELFNIEDENNNSELDSLNAVNDLKNEIISGIEENQEFESFYVDDKGEVIEDWNIIKKVPYLGLDWSWFDFDYWYKKIYWDIFIWHWSVFDIMNEWKVIYTNGDKYIWWLVWWEPWFRGLMKWHEGKVVREWEWKMLYADWGKYEWWFKDDKFVDWVFKYSWAKINLKHWRLMVDWMKIWVEWNNWEMVKALRKLCDNLHGAKSVKWDNAKKSIIITRESGNEEIKLDETGFKSWRRLSKWMNKYINTGK